MQCIDAAELALLSRQGLLLTRSLLALMAAQIAGRRDNSRESDEAPSIAVGITGLMLWQNCGRVSSECVQRARESDYDHRNGPPGFSGSSWSSDSSGTAGSVSASAVFVAAAPAAAREPEPTITDTTADSSNGDTSTDDSGIDGSSSDDSSSGGCTMPSPKCDIGLMGGTVLDGPRPEQTWEDCCVACQALDGCTGWGWMPVNAKCGDGPCCWLKDASGTYEQDQPGSVHSVMS